MNMDVQERRRAKRMLNLAARAAARGAGRVEPNPLVGAVLAQGDEVLAIGHHRVFGGAHAEVEAIGACRSAGRDPRGAQMYVTLEPCAHHGKQPPCVDAILEAGVSRVVIARADPNPPAAGGGEMLRARGVDVEFSDASENAIRLSDPFVKRVTNGLPWVIAKWAQSIDGKIATRHGESQWISSPTSRRRVHAMRGRVDVVLTGIGTVLADDPTLTSRDAGPARRVARRVVVDSNARTPLGSKLVRSAVEGTAPMTLCVAALADATRFEALDDPVEVFRCPAASEGGDSLDLRALLRHLVEAHDAMNVLVEAGPGLVGSLVRAELVDELRVFVAPMLFGDSAAMGAVEVGELRGLADAHNLATVASRASGGDVELRCRRSSL